MHFSTDAIIAYQRAIKLKPDHAEAWFNLGTCYAGTERRADEISAYQHAIALKPDYAQAWDGLALAYAYSGQPDKAKEALLALEKLDKTLAAKLAKLLHIDLHEQAP